MRSWTMSIGSFAFVGAFLLSQTAYAAQGDWNGPGWYAVITVAIGRALHSGPFDTQDGCVAGYSAHPSALPDAKMVCTYYPSEDAYLDDILGN